MYKNEYSVKKAGKELTVYLRSYGPRTISHTTFGPGEYDTYFWDGKNDLFIVRKDEQWVGCFNLSDIAGFKVGNPTK